MLTIQEVKTASDRRRFVRLPWAVNRNNPNFVPPLIAQEMLLVDPQRHPFYREGEGRFFLARRDGQLVGRIAAIRNRPYEAFWKEPCGFFGFYEATEDGEAGVEVTRALLGEVRRAMSAWGLTHFLGPANPSSNYTWGVLVEGFDLPPKIMMPYNPPRYDALLHASGLAAAKDLLAFKVEEGASEKLNRIRKIAARIESRHRVTLRTINMRKFEDEVAVINEIYNDIWEENWGFSPMSSAEFEHMAKEMKSLMDPDLALIAEIDGKPAGFCLVLPDIFEPLRHLNGRLFTPWAFLKLMVYTMIWPKIRSARVLALGVRKAYRTLGLGTIFYTRLFDVGPAKGYRMGEASWILEDNRPMVQALEMMDARCYKRYRVYRGETDTGTSAS